MKKNSKIYVAGHNGLAGSSIVRELKKRGYENIVTRPHNTDEKWFHQEVMPRNEEGMDLCSSFHIQMFFKNEQPEYVFDCAAHAGGIREAITNPVEMLSENLRIQINIMAQSFNRVKKLLFLGSSCIYPVNGEQPYKEEQLGTGKTDENWSYAIAKLAGIELARAYHRQYNCNFIVAIPCNLFGPGDNYDLDRAHVIPALIRKIHEAKENGDDFVEAWGTGHVKREFLHTADFANACVGLMENQNYDDLYDGVINIGSDSECSILDLAGRIRHIIGYKGQIKFNGDMIGVESKLLDSTRLAAFGWRPQICLNEGLEKVYEGYKEQSQNINR